MNLQLVVEPMPLYLTGSKAIKHWFPDFPREPKDTDYLVPEYCKYNQFPSLNSVKGTEYLKNKIITDLYHKTAKRIIEPDHLCTIKASHLFWNIKWEQSMFDLQFLLKKGCKIDKDLFWKLYNHWNEYHSKNKRSDLKMSKEDFFTNAINYDTVSHDELHKKLNPVPVYTKVLRDNCEVELDENKFYALSHEDKINFVKEEVMIMAFERYKELGFRRAYNKMLKKFIISHAPLFSLIFILENYIELEKCNTDFIKILK